MVKRRATSNFAHPIWILFISGLFLILQCNTIHKPDVAVTGCPLGDNPQISNLQRNFYLCMFFHQNLQIFESCKSQQSTILHLNDMPFIPLLWTKRGLAELIEHVKRRRAKRRS